MMRLITESLPGTGGVIKSCPDDFLVEEIPAYAPSGEGQHLFLLVEKRGVTTQDMVRRLAEALEIDAAEIGTAGQKDRMAVARQIVSVPATEMPIARVANLKLDGVAVLSAARHKNKLKTGHLRGNRFTIVIRGVCEGADLRARAILDALASSWLPNRFGAQRFGARGDNAEQGRALIDGKLRIADRFRRRFLLSAYQSMLFNRYLERRFDEGALHRVIEGEILQRVQSGGLFTCQPNEMFVAQARLDARQIVPTGPIFGHEMFSPLPGSPAALREQRLLEEEGLEASAFSRFGRLAEGTRRPVLVRVDDPGVVAIEDRLTVTFCLPSGSYATVVLDEIVKPSAPVDHPGDR